MTVLNEKTTNLYPETVLIGAWVERNLHPKEIEYICANFPDISKKNSELIVETSAIDHFESKRKNSQTLLDMLDFYKKNRDKKGMRIVRKIIQ